VFSPGGGKGAAQLAAGVKSLFHWSALSMQNGKLTRPAVVPNRLAKRFRGSSKQPASSPKISPRIRQAP
jgi:hypothetical protein